VPTTPPTSTVAIETHGCKLNKADSQDLATQFMSAGFQIVDATEPADIYILNSCTVTHVADRKARQALRAARRRNSNTLVIATGCYAQRSPKDLRELDGVTFVTGNTGKTDLVEQVLRLTNDIPKPFSTGFDVESVDRPPLGTRAMVKIQEGCNQVCAYCIVPKVRGRERSVPLDLMVKQVNQRVSQGYSEIVLTGTQLGSYGFDLPDATLETLISTLLSETAVARLRISSLQPQEITSGLLELWKDQRLCPHFHVPLQSGSNSVLSRMGRRYTSGQYMQSVSNILSKLPDAAITTDVLVGFPGEGPEEHAESLSLCRSIPFARMHIFPYSTRPGTTAAHFKDKVEDRLKTQRVHELLNLGQDHEAAFLRRFEGSIRQVLWEDLTYAQGRMVSKGLTDNYIRVISEANATLTGSLRQALLGKQAARGTVWAQAI